MDPFKITFPGQKTAAIASLEYGETLMFPCNERSVQSVQSGIYSLIARKGLAPREYTQQKSLLVLNEDVKPVAIILLTRVKPDETPPGVRE